MPGDHRKNAVNAAMTALTSAPLSNVALAAPAKTEALGKAPVVTFEVVLFAPFAVADEISVKFAQVKRVELLEWMTTDLSPKKYGDPGVVERYKSVYLRLDHQSSIGRGEGRILKANATHMTFQVGAVILPCLPARSPAWQV